MVIVGYLEDPAKSTLMVVDGKRRKTPDVGEVLMVHPCWVGISAENWRRVRVKEVLSQQVGAVVGLKFKLEILKEN
jgi:hypothetical protein